MSSDKPPYVVPTMADVRAAAGTNGYRMVSTFSGAGGSCIGFKLAGFDVIWASEFVPVAQGVYRTNHPGTHLDTRDIREVEPAEILDVIGLSPGDLDVLEGSPPCAAFSLAGSGSAKWGEVRKYSDTKQRVDDLFFEFARLVDGLQPRVFLAENVEGLVSGNAKGYFKAIMRALRACGYTVEAKLLNARWLGLPQTRSRLFFYGVREDLAATPLWPTPLPHQYTLHDALPHIKELWVKADFDVRAGEFGYLKQVSIHRAIGALMASGAVNGTSSYGVWDGTDGPIEPGSHATPSVLAAWQEQTHSTSGIRKFQTSELLRLMSYPADFNLDGLNWTQRAERVGRSVPPLMMRAVAEKVRELLDSCAD